jgi:hypothetical protein
MNRRNFLKGLGAGATIPLWPNIVSGDSVEPKETQQIESPTSFMTINGGYDLYQDYYWVRVSVEIPEGEWHDLFRFTKINCKKMSDKMNQCFRKRGQPYRVTARQIERALSA